MLLHAIVCWHQPLTSNRFARTASFTGFVIDLLLPPGLSGAAPPASLPPAGWLTHGGTMRAMGGFTSSTDTAGGAAAATAGGTGTTDLPSPAGGMPGDAVCRPV